MSIKDFYPDKRTDFERAIDALLQQSNTTNPDWYPHLDMKWTESSDQHFDIGGRNRVAMRIAQKHFQFDWMPTSQKQLLALQQIFVDLCGIYEEAGKNEAVFDSTFFGLDVMQLSAEELRRFIQDGPGALTDYFQNRLPTFIDTLDLVATMELEGELNEARLRTEEEAKALRPVETNNTETQKADSTEHVEVQTDSHARTPAQSSASTHVRLVSMNKAERPPQDTE